MGVVNEKKYDTYLNFSDINLIKILYENMRDSHEKCFSFTFAYTRELLSSLPKLSMALLWR